MEHHGRTLNSFNNSSFIPKNLSNTESFISLSNLWYHVVLPYYLHLTLNIYKRNTIKYTHIYIHCGKNSFDFYDYPLSFKLAHDVCPFGIVNERTTNNRFTNQSVSNKNICKPLDYRKTSKYYILSNI